MLRNYFKIACRNFWKNKFFSAINVVGLATGIAACLLTFFFIQYQKRVSTGFIRMIFTGWWKYSEKKAPMLHKK
jgi:hypothetical protein